MNAVHPIFADILRGIELQPAMLKRAADKAEPRRFSAEPITAMGDLGIGVRGSDRWAEVRAEEFADQRREERAERQERE